jgi:glutathione synthase/RimK-type ligase-like ATP-grasp enzyme
MNQLTIGLWLPARESLTGAITHKTPAVMDARVRRMFGEYLDESGIKYYENLDFRQAIIKNNKVYIDDFCVSDLDIYIWNGLLDRSLDSYHFEILRVLEFNVKVYNSYSFYHIATDKFSAFSQLHNHNIPVSDLFLVNRDNIEYLESYFEQHSFLLKPRRSSFGLGIVKVDRFSQLRDILEYYPKQNYYLEKYYPNDMSQWTGVTVINGTALYGYRKKAEKIKDWKVYDKKRAGGKIEFVQLTPELEAVAIEVGELLGACFYGLDFIKTEEGYKIVDINCHPGIYYDLIEDLNIPISELFFDMLKTFKTAQLIA